MNTVSIREVNASPPTTRYPGTGLEMTYRDQHTMHPAD
jgi:hypothetical protein